MATPDVAQAAAPRAGALARLLRAPWFTIVTGVLAVAVFATAAVAYVVKFAPFESAATSQYAPSAFATTLVATTSPLVSRGGTVSLSVQSYAPDEVAAIELWDGDRLYYRLDDPGLVPTSASGLVSLDVDFVATTAGSHVLSVRTVSRDGQTSLSDPLTLPVLDLAADTLTLPTATTPSEAVTTSVDPASGELVTRSAPFTPWVTLASSIGDTATAIAARLAVDPGAMLVDAQTVADAGAVLPAGSAVRAPLVDRDIAKQAGYGLADVAEWATGLTGSVSDCTVSISLDGIPGTLALFATSPLQPGYVRIGDVSADAPWVSATMPIGPTIYIAYRTGASDSSTGGENAPTAPLYLSVPESCASEGWTGDARIVNGALVTDYPVEKPYAYVSVDQNEWVRVPAQQGQYLSTGSINDIRSSLTLAQYDQVDIEVWSNDGDLASRAAAGQFCRKDVPNAQPANTSSSDSETACRPSGPAPGGDTTLAKNGSMTIAFDSGLAGAAEPVSPFVLGAIGEAAAAEGIGSDPYATTSIHLGSDQPVTLVATLANSDANRVIFQYSYFPLSATTTAISPPGVFATQTVNLAGIPGQPSTSTTRQATTTFEPWAWRNAHRDGDSSTFSSDGNNLQLDDELALAMANEKLDAGKNLIDTVYVRAIAAVAQYYGTPKPSGIASQSLVVDMTDQTAYPIMSSPGISLEPGVDQSFTDTALRGKCFEVLSLPEPDTYLKDPESGPKYDVQGNLERTPTPENSDLAWATAVYQPEGAVQCLWKGSDESWADLRARQEQKANDCGLDCIIFAVAVGAIVGFAAGGPAGAFVGGAAGAALALGNPELAAQIYNAAKQYWDLVASTYNLVMGSITFVISKLNPICGAIGAAGAGTAQSACELASASVAAAAITAFTGLPPSLPMSSAVVEIAKGEMQGVLVLALEVLLSAAGTSCAAFTIENPAAIELLEQAGTEIGNGNGKKLVDASKKDGTLSGCEAVANLVMDGASSLYTETQGSYMTSAMETEIIPGTLVEAVTDTTPVIAVVGFADGATRGDKCPVTVNVVKTQPYVWPGGTDTVPSSYSFTLAPITGELLATGSADGPLEWRGTVAIPVLPKQSGVFAGLLLDPPAPAEAGLPFLRIYVDSPCLAETYQLDATEYEQDGRSFAFAVDTRSSVSYLGLPQ